MSSIPTVNDLDETSSTEEAMKKKQKDQSGVMDVYFNAPVVSTFDSTEGVFFPG